MAHPRVRFLPEGESHDALGHVYFSSRLSSLVQLASAQSTTVSANQPAFDAATIKPPDPQHQKAGFYGEAGGRVFIGGNIRMLVQYAFNLGEFQVAGGPEWAASQWFEINAVPPDSSPSRNIKVRNAQPTSEQRLMLAQQERPAKSGFRKLQLRRERLRFRS